MFRETQKMQVGAVIQDCPASCDANGPSEIAHEVEQSRGELEALRRKATQSQGYGRRHGKLLRKAAKRLWQQQLVSTPLMRDRREVPHADREQSQSEHQQPAKIDASREKRIKRNRGD